MSVTQRLDRFQQRHPVWGLPLAVLYKYVDDQGNYLAALITYYAVVSLFPLLLLLSTILGFVLHGNPELQKSVLDSALGAFPVVKTQLRDPHGISGSGAGIAVGVVGTLYGGLGVGQALQNAMNTTWLIPRNCRGNPLRQRGRSLLLLCVLGVSVLGTTVLSALTFAANSYGAQVGMSLKVPLFAASVLVNAAVFVLAFKVSTARDVTVREVAPGAVLAGIAWQILQTFGTVYIGHVVRNASDLNAVFALVLGLIVWIYLEAVAVVFATELNVVRTMRLYPRALLTPFTDNVQLTRADRAAYTGVAEAQRIKGFEDIDVTFSPVGQGEPDPPEETG
jgi:membrane protein